eukprot:scaffold2438_cov167-Amphora_coffeaeformis.AAC.17
MKTFWVQITPLLLKHNEQQTPRVGKCRRLVFPGEVDDSLGHPFTKRKHYARVFPTRSPHRAKEFLGESMHKVSLKNLVPTIDGCSFTISVSVKAV